MKLCGVGWHDAGWHEALRSLCAAFAQPLRSLCAAFAKLARAKCEHMTNEKMAALLLLPPVQRQARTANEQLERREDSREGDDCCLEVLPAEIQDRLWLYVFGHTSSLYSFSSFDALRLMLRMRTVDTRGFMQRQLTALLRQSLRNSPAALNLHYESPSVAYLFKQAFTLQRAFRWRRYQTLLKFSLQKSQMLREENQRRRPLLRRSHSY